MKLTEFAPTFLRVTGDTTYQMDVTAAVLREGSR